MYPLLQVKPQEPLAQVPVEFAGAVHAWAHAEQLFGSLVSSTQKPLQSEYPPLHANEHALLTQAGLAWTTPVEHAAHAVPLPHAVADVPAWQAPPEQQPLAHAYAAPQPPQLWKSV